jgi:hypothetical protein
MQGPGLAALDAGPEMARRSALRDAEQSPAPRGGLHRSRRSFEIGFRAEAPTSPDAEFEENLSATGVDRRQFLRMRQAGIYTKDGARYAVREGSQINRGTQCGRLSTRQQGHRPFAIAGGKGHTHDPTDARQFEAMTGRLRCLDVRGFR